MLLKACLNDMADEAVCIDMVQNLFRGASLLFILMLASCVRAQHVPPRLQTGYPELDKKLSQLISADEHAISATEAHELAGAIFLDARESEEYDVSHLPSAFHLGYNSPDYDQLEKIDKSRPVVVYCTVGYRSERAAKKLRKLGFNQVYNLYGSIYAWTLAGLPLMDAENKTTEKVHTYNRKWGSFVPDSIGEKVW